MHPRLKRFGKYGVYVLVTLLLILYFIFFTFPYDSVKDRYLAEWVQGLPYRVTVESIRATPLLWIHAAGIQVIPEEDNRKEALLQLSEIRIRPSFLRLLMGRLSLRVKALLYGGKIQGRTGKGKETVDLSLDWKNIQLAQLPVQEKLPESELKGTLEGEMDLHLRIRGNRLLPGGEGTLKTRLTGGAIKNLLLRGFSLPALEGITGNGEFTLGQNRATLESLSLNADQLTFSLEGKADLSPRLMSSLLNLKGRIKLSGSLASQYQPMLAGFLRKQDKEGFYTFSIRGTLGNPRLSL